MNYWAWIKRWRFLSSSSFPPSSGGEIMAGNIPSLYMTYNFMTHPDRLVQTLPLIRKIYWKPYIKLTVTAAKWRTTREYNFAADRSSAVFNVNYSLQKETSTLNIYTSQSDENVTYNLPETVSLEIYGDIITNNDKYFFLSHSLVQVINGNDKK